MSNNNSFSYERSLVEFVTRRCEACKSMSYQLHSVINYFDGNVLLFRIDVDYDFDSVSKFNIIKFPTVIFFKDRIEKHRVLGYKKSKRIIFLIKKFL